MLEYSRRNCRCSEASWRKTSIAPFAVSLTTHLPEVRRHDKSFRRRVFDRECNRRRQQNRTLQEHLKWTRNVRGTDNRLAPNTHKNVGSEKSGGLPRNGSSRSCKKCSPDAQDKRLARDSLAQMTP